MNEIAFPDSPTARAGFKADHRVPDAGNGAAEAARPPLLTQYLRILIRRRWIIIGTVAVTMVVGLLVTLLTTPQYTAITKVQISRQDAKVLNVEGVEPERRGADLEFYQTQYGLLNARTLAERVARDLRLVDDAAFFEAHGVDPQPLFAKMPNRTDQATRQQRERLAATILLNGLVISPQRGSSLVDISFTDPNPRFAARVSNAWATNFISLNLERRFETTAYARKFVEQRLEQVRQQLEDSERALVAYAQRERIINVPSSSEGGAVVERPLVASDLAALSSALSTATAERIQAEARWRQASRGVAGLSEAQANSTIASLRRDRAQAAAEREQLLVRFEPGYPGVQALASRIRELDRGIAAEEARVRTGLERDYRAAADREKTLEAQVNGLKSNLLDTRGRSIQYNIYQRDVDTNREQYNGLLQRFKDLTVVGGVGTNNVSIIDPAVTPSAPSKPNLLRNMMLAILLGGMLGLALAFAREQVDDAINDAAEAEQAFGLPVLGVVPYDKSSDPVLTLADPKSSLREAYLAIQTNLAFTTEHGVPRSLAVTSTGAAEGKSTTSYALALMLARAGRRVVLIDADMRAPSVHHLTGNDNKAGLSNYLAGDDDLDTLLHKAKSGPDVMSAGPAPPNAAELLTGDRLQDLISQLLERYDNIVVDSPPVLGLADAPLVAGRMEGVIFAAEVKSRGARVIRRALQRLSVGQANLLGIVLTKLDTSEIGYGYGEEYGYGYGSGDRSDGKQTSA